MREAMSRIGQMLGVRGNYRKPHGYWLPYAWAVRALVAGGAGVSAACRAVLKHSGLKEDRKTLNCVRVIYYKVSHLPWPDGLRETLCEAYGIPVPKLGWEEVVEVEESPSDESPDESPPIDDPEWEEPNGDCHKAEPVAVVASVNPETGLVDDPDADPDYVPESEIENFEA